ncbi:uncharacterized protein TRAVEDRAFT_52065 [Trametes versicolor FP-101664 SS1]|uniref:uncharacterized protein n=1 Tax=Trametes versicolor (strain FP-101664) TaxID=717944 RepID=UPI0004622FEF|nr:uncharacterized protein TRAVEDRAFT_52065 [Trametes versicolor FP-101664 SS1]EIW54357.1 hypothetical protein TRAVEDRAFT_52065 [Trametes versicolor FP-101664 SS1]
MANAEALDRCPADTTSNISPLAEKQRPIHRSVRALERNADVFVWWPTNTLIACFNAQVTPVTPEVLLRWIGMPIDMIRSGEIIVKRVRLEHRAVLNYGVHPLELIQGSENLSPGVYGCYFRDIPDPTDIPEDLRPISPGIHVRTFKQIRDDHEGHVRENPWMWPSDQIERTNSKFYTIPDALRSGVTVAHDRCIFTGYPRKATASDTSTDPMSAATTGVTSGAAAEDPVELYWIVPKKMGGENGTKHLTKEEWWSSNNILPMCSRVHELWFTNELSVDANDGYRIRTFSEAAASVMAGLPGRLDNPNPEWGLYFRLHLLHTRLLRFCGGDIRTEYGYRRMADLSVLIAKADALASREAAIWKTEMGKDALELLDAGKQLDLPSSDDEDGASDSGEEI